MQPPPVHHRDMILYYNDLPPPMVFNKVFYGAQNRSKHQFCNSSYKSSSSKLIHCTVQTMHVIELPECITLRRNGCWSNQIRLKIVGIRFHRKEIKDTTDGIKKVFTTLVMNKHKGKALLVELFWTNPVNSPEIPYRDVRRSLWLRIRTDMA